MDRGVWRDFDRVIMVEEGWNIGVYNVRNRQLIEEEHEKTENEQDRMLFDFFREENIVESDRKDNNRFEK